MKNLINIENISDTVLVSSGAVTANYWGDCSGIKLIPMADGSFALGVNVCYVRKTGGQDQSYHNETCRIQIDKNNVPYVEFDGNSMSFTSKNCKQKINTMGFAFGMNNVNVENNIVEGYPIYTFQNKFIPENSIFEFVGDCVSDEKIQEFFVVRKYAVGLSDKSLAILTKFVENPENKSIIEKCLNPSNEYMVGVQDDLKQLFNNYVNGECGEKELMSKIKNYKKLVNKEIKNPNFCIPIDLSKYEYLLDKNPNQPGNN